MRRFLFIANASAGTSDAESIEAALNVLRDAGEVEVVETADLEQLTVALRGLDGREAIVAGGDGSLNAFATALSRIQELGEDPPTVGLVPLGTGNDFAAAVGIPEDATEAAGVVLSGPAKPIDVLVDDDGNVTVNAVHIGVGEEAGRIAAPWKERLGKVGLGGLGYVIGGVAAGFSQGGRHLRVVADDKVVTNGKHHVLQVAVTIGESVGGGTQLAPDAMAGDGLAEVVVSQAISPSRRLKYAVRINRGRHTELDDVISVRAKEVTVTGMSEKVGANSDGEALEPAKERTWKVVEGAYHLHTNEATE